MFGDEVDIFFFLVEFKEEVDEEVEEEIDEEEDEEEEEENEREEEKGDGFGESGVEISESEVVIVFLRYFCVKFVV